MSANAEYSPFPVTQWTMVDRAATHSSVAGAEALEELLIRYRPALKAHLVYVKRISSESADDYIQSFVAGKILQGELIAHADRTKGKFRTFLLTAFDRYIKNEVAKKHAKKRSPEGGFVPMDELQDAEKGEPLSSNMFDMAWAREIIDESLQQVKKECCDSDRSHYWDLFEARVIKPIFMGEKSPAYDELMKATPFSSPMQASNALITVKRMFARNLKDVIRQYTASDDGVEEELNELRKVISEST